MEDAVRHLLWAVAVLCEYVSPMFGFPLPGLGRSRTTDWTIDGGHLATEAPGADAVLTSSGSSRA